MADCDGSVEKTEDPQNDVTKRGEKKEEEAQMSEKEKRKAKAKAKAQAEAASRPPPIPPTRLLFIGNSLSYFNSGIWFHLHKLCRTANIKVECTKVVKGGASLEVMWTGEDDQLGEDGLSKARGAVMKGGHDIVVLQEDLPETSVELFHMYTRKFVEDARASTTRERVAAAEKPEHESEASSTERKDGANKPTPQGQAGSAMAARSPEVVLLMTWEYSRLGWISQERIAEAHHEIAAELTLQVVPAGTAWLKCRMQRPDLELYMSDGEHPSINGSYLTVCLTFATLFLRHPRRSGGIWDDIVSEEAEKMREGLLPYRPTGVSEEDAAYMQRLACECVSATKS